MSKLTQAFQQVDGEREDVVVLFVTVDVDRDTPEALAEYLGYFSLNSFGLTGSREEVDAVVAQYGAAYQIEDAGSEMGPMVAEKERTRYEGVLEHAQQQGAQLLLGGGRPAGLEHKGWFVEPTILTGCDPDMDILNNESFGPVAPICKVESFDPHSRAERQNQVAQCDEMRTVQRGERHALATARRQV